MISQNPKTVAISDNNPSASFGDVEVETKEGDKYKFPLMNITTLKQTLPETGRVPEDQPSLVMLNMSMASLVIPFRIISVIWAGEEGVIWESSDA